MGSVEGQQPSSALAQAPSSSGVGSGPSALPPVATLKYHTQLAAIENCPPLGLQSPTGPAFRFAKLPLTHPDNELPIAYLTPTRVIAGKAVIECCNCYSLSFFQTLPQLRAKFAKGLKNAPNLAKRLGTHYVQINLTNNSGRCTPANSSGHFELFEFSSFSIHAAVLSQGLI